MQLLRTVEPAPHCLDTCAGSGVAGRGNRDGDRRAGKQTFAGSADKDAPTADLCDEPITISVAPRFCQRMQTRSR